MKQVYSIVVTYNGIQWIEKCLNSLIKSSYPSHILVIDNGSKDATVSFIRNNYQQIEIIESKKNLGFGQANNVGISIAIKNNADYVFLLNQDAWVEADTISTLVDTQLNNPEFGIISPLHLNGEGSRIDNYFFQYFLKSDIKEFIDSRILNRNPESNLINTQFINAAAWLMTTKCILKTGGFDPIFFHYGEDMNYAQRVLFWGFKIGIQITAKIYHDREERTLQANTNIDTILRKEWLHFLTQVCDIRRPQFLKIIFRRFARYCSHTFMSLFTFNRNQIRYNSFMAGKTISSIFKIAKSRKISLVVDSLPYL